MNSNTDRRIRILLTVPHLKATASPYREMLSIARHLDRDQFQLAVCSLRKGGYEETKSMLNQMKVPCFVAAFRPRNHSWRDTIHSIRSYGLIARHGPFQVQHSLDFSTSPFEGIMARCYSRSYIFHQRNMDGQHPRLLRWKGRLASRIVAISRPIETFLRGNGISPARMVCIPNGLDTSLIRKAVPCAEREPGLLLNVAFVQRHKRQDLVIKAFAEIAREFPQTRLLLAGGVFDEDYYRELVGLVDSLELTARVQFLGEIDDVPSLMSRSTALLTCSETEGLSWVLLEAAHSYLPIIASRIRANSELIRDGQTGLLVEVGDHGKFAGAIRTILQAPNLAALMAERAKQELARRFSAARMVRQLEDVYRDVAGIPNPS